MKDKKPTSTLKRILITCTNQAKDYGTCVAAKVPEIERDMCSKEFLALKTCMQNVSTEASARLTKDYWGSNRINRRKDSVRCSVSGMSLQEKGNMSGTSSNTLSGVGLSESGSLSHVYIQRPPLRCSISGSRGLFYDDGNKLLLSPTSDQVFSWDTSLPTPQSAPNVDFIDEGPVLSIRYSLDGKVIGIQRSVHEIQFRERETGQHFSQRCKSDSENILGFFWTDCPNCDIIFVKTSGLDLFSYEPDSKALRLVETKKLNVSWYVYTHESRMILLAFGMQCKTISGFQFSSGGIIRLPRFEMSMGKAEANQKPVLAEEDVHIVIIYGRIYCLQVDRVSMQLHLYRFYRDAVVRQSSLPIFSSKIAVSVIDNVLLVHQLEAKVVILYDVFSDSRAPISAPLPLLLRGMPKANTRSVNKDDVQMESNEMKDYETVIYGDGWTFLVPDMICDVAHGNVWRIHLDLEAISASSSEAASVLEFLQRRKLEPNKAKHLCLSILRTLILERRPVPLVSKAIDVLVSSYAHSMKTGVPLRRVTMEGERSTSSSQQLPDGSGTISEVERRGSVSGVNKESRQSLFGDMVNESFSLTTGSRDNRSSSDSEENMNLKVVAEVSKSVAEQLSSQSQIPTTGGSNISEQRESDVTSPVVSPDEMYNLVFSPIEEEMSGDPAYMVSILMEYFRSAALEKLKVHPNLNVMIIQLLARSERYAELGLSVIHKIIEPSKEVALQLLIWGRQNLQTKKLGMDMLRQLALHHDYVLLLVQEGYYLQALRYARRNKVNSIQPKLFLEAAFASNDPQHLAAILRFFSDFIPGFRNTSEHRTYCGILNEMNSPLAT